MKQFSTYVGLDVHKNSITVAIAAPGDEKPRSLGRLPNDLTRLLRALEPLGDPARVQTCYEAGPTGYGLVRRLRRLGYDCQVVAPAKTPRMASVGVKTDRRDAIKLADFLRSGHLTGIRVPTEEEEALRDLIRAREDIKVKETNSKRQLNSMMLRHGRIFRTGKYLWTKKHSDWIEAQEFEFEASREAKNTYVGEVRRYAEMLEGLDKRIEEVAGTLARADLIHALRAFKGTQDPDRGDDRRGGGRPAAFPERGQVRELPRTHTERALDRRRSESRLHHEGRKQEAANYARRSGLGVLAQSAREPRAGGSVQRSDAEGAGHQLEDAEPAESKAELLCSSAG